MKRRDVIRFLVIACVTIAALGILAPAEAPATNSMQVELTTTVTTFSTWSFGPWTFTVTFTFSNTTLEAISQVPISTATVYFSHLVASTVTTTIPNLSMTTTTTYRSTQTSGTTIVSSTSTTLTGTSFTEVVPTVVTTASETVTSTFHTTTSVTTTSTYSVTGSAPPTLPIPGFPLESIIAGLLLGLVGVSVIYRKRRANREVSA